MTGFLQALEVQRWDDHRYYHQSRINQSLHLVSAVSLLCAYMILLSDPALAALIGWLIALGVGLPLIVNSMAYEYADSVFRRNWSGMGGGGPPS